MLCRRRHETNVSTNLVDLLPKQIFERSHLYHVRQADVPRWERGLDFHRGAKEARRLARPHHAIGGVEYPQRNCSGFSVV